MADERIGIDVDLNSNTKGLDNAITALEGMSAQIGALSKGLSQTSRNAETMARSLGRAAGAQTSALKAQADQLERISKLQKSLNDTSNRAPDAIVNRHYRNSQYNNPAARLEEVTQARNARLEAERTLQINKLQSLSGREWHKQLELIEKEYGEIGRAAALAAERGKGVTVNSAQATAGRMGIIPKVAPGMINANVIADMERYRASLDATLGPQRALVAHLQEEEAATNRLTNARYAMFAAGASLAAGSFALGAAMLGMVSAAMDYETALAQISRTSGMTGLALQNFSGDLRDLASTIPIAFADISEIATLGGQLNISQENLAGFTESVAQFGMTTNVQAGTAAEAFGRLNGLLPDVRDNYDALGSSILNVGVNSVATESDIIGTATQIAAVGSQAGFSADEVIGFAAAMRSVGINPYLSRGGLTRIFGVISDAIANGGASLDEFAALSGRSAQAFESDWRDSAATTFIDLLRGMEQARQGGEDLYQTMNRLGVVNSQDRQVLAVLSQNYDELTSAISYANDGFTEGTQLQAAFDVQAGTLASRLQMLMNALHALFAVTAGSSLAVFGPLVVGATEAATALADLISQSPLLQGLLATLGGLATAGAAIGLVAGTVTLFTAAIIAGRTAMRVLTTEIEVAKLAMMEKSVAAAQNTMAVNANTGAIGRANIAQTGLAAKLNETTIRMQAATAATAAYTAATGAPAVSNMQALRQVLIGGADGGNRFTNALSKGAAFLMSPWTIAIGVGIAALEALRMGIESTHAQSDAYTAALNESASATRLFTLANQGVNLRPFDTSNLDRVPALLDLIAQRSRSSIGALSEFGNIAGYVDLNASGLVGALSDIEQGMLALGDSQAMRGAFINFAQSLNLSEEGMRNLLTSMPELRQAMITGAEGAGELEAGFDGVITEGDLFNLIMQEVANGVGYVAGEAMVGSEAMYYLADSAAEAGGELQTVSDILNSEFAMPTMLGELGASMRDFALGIAEGGMIFSAVAAEGQVNVANFQAMVGAAIVAGQSQGFSAADSINNLFATLKANGLDVMAILQALQSQGVASMAGISMANLQRSASGAQGATSQLGTYMNTVYQNAMQRASATTARAARSVGGGGGSRGGSPRSLGGAARAAAVEVRSLVDYTNDLRKVMDRAFELRFGSGQAMDKISSGWAEIAEKIADAQESMADANQEIAETQAKMAELTADQSIKNYFLAIADAYGDTLRGDELRAELAKIDADMASEQKNLADAQRERAEAQDEMAMSLTGDSAAARENRSNILGLAESYQDYLLALASSGTSQADLQRQAAALKSQFMEQGLAAGFSADELGLYAKAFDDLGSIIARVPYNVNVAFNSDPALQALAEFDAEAAAAAARAGENAGRAYSGGVGRGINGGGGFGIPDIALPEMPDFGDLFGVKANNNLPLNDGTRIVAPRDGNDIYDPTYGEGGTGFVGGEGAEDAGKDWWTLFWEGLTTGADQDWGSGQYVSNIGLGWAGAIARNMVPGVKKGANSAAKAASSELVEKGGWTEKGLAVGGKFGEGQKLGYTTAGVALNMAQKLSAAPWGSRGDQTGSTFGSAQKLGYERSAAGSAMVASLGTKNWAGGGRTAGSQFGGGTKAGFNAANPVSSMTGSVAGASWYGHGRNAGSNVGTGLKSGFDDSGVAGRLQSAIKDAAWHANGKTIGYRIADGIKAGFNESNVKVPAVGKAPATGLKMYQSGGFTGTGANNQIAGMVHKNEFVMPADATRRIGVANLEAMRRGGNVAQTSSAPSIMVVEFSAYDRELIAAGQNVQVVLGGGQIAAAASAANVIANNRGSN